MVERLEGKALVTGASGFVGSHVREALIERGLDVLALRRPGSPAARVGRSHEASYDDLRSLTSLMADERPDYVFHVAGVTKGRTYVDFADGNVMPTRNLLRALTRAGVAPKRFVHVSSLSAWGPSTPVRPVCEEDPPSPVEYYGRSKLESERVLSEFEDIPSTIIRPAAVFGPRDVDYFNLFDGAHRGFDLYFGNADKPKSAIYVADLVEAILRGAVTERAVGRSYFIAHPEIVTWRQFQSWIVEATPRKRAWAIDFPSVMVDLAALGGEVLTRIDGKPRLFNRQKAIMGAQEAWTCAVDRAHEELEFVSTTPLRDAVHATAEWYRREGWIRAGR
jgi:nucleoside-diphosphate-sugar epimerase